MNLNGDRERIAVARYVALDAGSESGTEPERTGAANGPLRPGSVTKPPSPEELEVFARCDAVLAAAQRLAGRPELAWAYDEARQLARSGPPAIEPPWYRRVGLAWGTAAVSTAAAATLALQLLMPASEPPAMAAPASPESSLAAIVSAAEISRRVAEFDSSVLIGDSVAVDGRSLVVLPFASSPPSLRMQPALNGATAGLLYERLVNQLAAMPGISVIDPSTAAVYADGAIPPAQIALYLGVRGVVQASVDSDGETVSIDYRFTDAAGAGFAINRAFERPVEELAMLQNDMAMSVLDALGRPSAPSDIQP